MSYPTLRLHPRKEESVLRFHPWIFSGAIASFSAPVEDGDLVSVVDSKGRPLGTGHFGGGSIAVRLLSFDAEEVIDRAFYKRRLEAALRLRLSCDLVRPVGSSDSPNTTYRLVHGEGDSLPGLIIDIYDRTAVVQAHSLGMHQARQTIAEVLWEVFAEAGDPVLPLEGIYYKSETTLPTRDMRELASDGFLIGHTEAAPIYENGVRFTPDWLKGQKTGFFIDQRDNRALVAHYAKGRTVLNAFCYTGGFSIYALHAGAKRVDSLDSSAKAMYLTEQHVALNFGADCPRHHSVTEDAFGYLERMREGEYDLIILDPPAFAKHRKVLRNALIGYRKINSIAFKKVAPGGIVFTFSCSQAVSKEEFRLAVFTAAAASGRKVRILHQLTQPVDHPINIYHPEGEYLKGLVLYVE